MFNSSGGLKVMAETSQPLSKEQIFRQVKQLCMQRKFIPSRHLICQAAGIDVPNPMKISRNDIRRQTANPITLKMLDIEQACVGIQQTFSKDEPSVHEAEATAQNLNNILPFMTNNNEKFFVRYWLDNCYSYMPDISQEQRADNIKELINLIPKGKNDSALYNYSLILQDLNIPVSDKYLAIKKAYRKTNKDTHFAPRYKELLNKTARRYYQVLYNTATQADTPYHERCHAVYEAVEVLKDVDYSMSHKCRARIELLDKLEWQQQQHNDRAGLQKTFLLRNKYVNHLNNIGRLFPNRSDEYLYR